jgi:hypothetical protein
MDEEAKAKRRAVRSIADAIIALSTGYAADLPAPEKDAPEEESDDEDDTSRGANGKAAPAGIAGAVVGAPTAASVGVVGTFQTMAEMEVALEKAEARGLIERDHVRVKPTPLGRRFLNDLLEIFL